MAEDKTQKIIEIMKHPERVRNICTIAHIDHGKSTLSDNLLWGAGMISEELAGKQVFMDFLEEEKQRGITIQTAAVSMVHTFEGQDYLINLMDTPGHVDFGGDVTRALRAVDGAICLACAVEGVMPQTETVLRQAIKDRVRPVLFINKVDRLIREVKLTPEQMQERFVKIINNVNELIRGLCPPELKDKWSLSVQEGTVAFGSAFHNWGLSLSYMKKKGISFKDIIEAYQKDTWKELAKRAPLHESLLDMIIKHCPNPVDAQKYRIPKLWPGDLESDTGKQLTSCDPNAPLVFVVTKISVDPQAGEIATGRVFAGTMKKGEEIYMNTSKQSQRIQQVVVYKGAQRIIIDEVRAGNVAGIVGLKGSSSGETISIGPMVGFEAIKHLFEPVVTKAIEAKNPQDLPKLIEILKQLEKEDPTIHVEINEETGENIIAGLGELHLEIKEHIIERDKGLQIVVSPPIVVYRETVESVSPEVMGKSPNKHNQLFVSVEPLEPDVTAAIKRGEIAEGKIKKKKDDLIEALVTNGMDRDEAKSVRDIYKGNVLVDATRGIVHIGEIIEMVIEAFEEACRAGPMAREPLNGVKVKLTDCKLHEDSIHRGPGQLIPAMRQAIFNALLSAGDLLYEPKQTIRIDAPVDYLGNISKLIQSRRGQLLDTDQEGIGMTVKAILPVAEMFGFTSALRSATTGRGASFMVDQSFEKLPTELQQGTVLKLRKRKGLKEEIPQPEFD